MPVTGTLYPYEDVTLAPKVGGRVIRVHRDVGDRVSPGDPLLELDDAEYQLAVAQARAAFDAELRKLKLTALPAADFLAQCNGWEMGIELRSDLYGLMFHKIWEREPLPTAAAMLRDAVNLLSPR